MTSTLEEIGITRKQFMEKYFRVLNKNKELVPFKLNNIQDLELSEQSDIGRDEYVKPAQIGSTTLWVGVGLTDAMTSQGHTAVIVSYDDDHASRLLLKATQLLDNIRTEVDGTTYRWPQASRNNKNEIFFPDLQSTIFVGSARQYNFGRGEPIHMLVGSEVAFWPDASKILVPAEDRVPFNGQIILESTPNGQEGPGKFFYKNYLLGKGIAEDEPDLASIYKSHFYPWWFHDEYQIEEGSKYALPKDRFGELELTEEEFDLCRLHGLTDSHIRWRRRKMLEKRQHIELGESPLLFQQEFPEDDVNCWLISGNSYYDPVIVNQLAKQCYTAPKTYNGAAVWYEPEESHDYFVTIDPGMGKQSRTVIHVWETITDEEGIDHDRHCATASGFFLESETCDRAVTLAEYFHRATIAPEANIPAVAALLVERRYPYIYMREDLIDRKSTRRPGWLTTPRSKMLMFQRLSQFLPYIITHDKNLVDQLPNVRQEGDKVVINGRDDHHDAAAIYMVVKRNSAMGKSRFAGSYADSNTWWSR